MSSKKRGPLEEYCFQLNGDLQLTIGVAPCPPWRHIFVRVYVLRLARSIDLDDDQTRSLLKIFNGNRRATHFYVRSGSAALDCNPHWARYREPVEYFIRGKRIPVPNGKKGSPQRVSPCMPGKAVQAVTHLACLVLPANHRSRYSDEWYAELFDLPRSRRLVHAVRVLRRAPATRASIRATPVAERGT